MHFTLHEPNSHKKYINLNFKTEFKSSEVLTNDIFYPKLLSFFLLSRSEYLGTWKRTHFVVIGKLLEEMLQGRMEFSKYKKSLTASKVRESKIRTNMI